MFDIHNKLDYMYQKENWEGIIKIGEKLFQDGAEDIKILNDLAIAYRNKKMLNVAGKNKYSNNS